MFNNHRADARARHLQALIDRLSRLKVGTPLHHALRLVNKNDWAETLYAFGWRAEDVE